MRRKELTYKDFEVLYPDYLILLKVGSFYTARNKSAEVLRSVMHFYLGTDEHDNRIIGCNNVGKVLSFLKNKNFSYIIIENNDIIGNNKGLNPFSPNIKIIHTTF